MLKSGTVDRLLNKVLETVKDSNFDVIKIKADSQTTQNVVFDSKLDAFTKTQQTFDANCVMLYNLIGDFSKKTTIDTENKTSDSSQGKATFRKLDQAKITILNDFLRHKFEPNNQYNQYQHYFNFVTAKTAIDHVSINISNNLPQSVIQEKMNEMDMLIQEVVEIKSQLQSKIDTRIAIEQLRNDMNGNRIINSPEYMDEVNAIFQQKVNHLNDEIKILHHRLSCVRRKNKRANSRQSKSRSFEAQDWKLFVEIEIDELQSIINELCELPVVPLGSSSDSHLPILRKLRSNSGGREGHFNRLYSFLLGHNRYGRLWHNEGFVWPGPLVSAGFSYDGEDDYVVWPDCLSKSDTTDEEYAFRMHGGWGLNRKCPIVENFVCQQHGMKEHCREEHEGDRKRGPGS